MSALRRRRWQERAADAWHEQGPHAGTPTDSRRWKLGDAFESRLHAPASSPSLQAKWERAHRLGLDLV